MYSILRQVVGGRWKLSNAGGAEERKIPCRNTIESP